MLQDDDAVHGVPSSPVLQKDARRAVACPHSTFPAGRLTPVEARAMLAGVPTALTDCAPMSSIAHPMGPDAPQPTRAESAASEAASAAPAAEVVSAGNEVLSGDVVDTNSNRLCTLVTGLGGVMTRTVMVRDELEAIAREIAGAVAREPALVFTVGGLGPTSDDRTLAGGGARPRGAARAAPRGRAHSAREVRRVPRPRLRPLRRDERRAPQDGDAAGRRPADRQPDRRGAGRPHPGRPHRDRLAPRRP